METVIYKYINKPADIGAPIVLNDPERDAKNARALEIIRARQADPNYCKHCSRVHRGGPCKG